jgi:ABC-type nitrate/sulfonate/bicarbonate transport system substrate-binding protein
MHRHPTVTRLLAAFAFTFAVTVSAQVVTLGINAGVTTRDTNQSQEGKFGPLAQAASKALRLSLQVKPVKSPDVPKEIAEKRLDLLLIHTHDALAAAKKDGYQVVAFSQDAKDDRIRFMAAKTGPTRLADARGRIIWSAGGNSFATAVGRAVLRGHGLAAKDVTLKITSYQDAIPFMLHNEFGELGITRVDSVARAWESDGGRVLYATDRLPVYAVVARPGMDPSLVDRIGAWLVGLTQSDEATALLAGAGLVGFRGATPKEVASLSHWFAL